MNYALIIEIINGIGFLLFVGLLGAALIRMVARIVAYRLSERGPSIILRRDFALLGSFLAIFGTNLAIRFFGLGPVFQDPGLPRLLYVFIADVLGNGALLYWVWAEYFVIGQIGKENN